MQAIRLSVRQLVEFLLQTGSIDSRFAGFDRAQEGTRIHRQLQKAAGAGYQAEVTLKDTPTAAGIHYQIEGRADGIFADETGLVTIDEIKTTAQPPETITGEQSPCHWAQGMVYAAIYGSQNGLDTLAVRLTYFHTESEKLFRFTKQFPLDTLQDFYHDLLADYAPWAKRKLAHESRRGQSLAALAFPFPAWRPGQRALAGAVYNTFAAEGGRLFCQAPTGIGKTMSTVFPALKSMGEGKGEKLFYLTARNTAAGAAEEALALLRTAQPGLALRSITLAAKEKVCLCPNDEGRPECLPERCPYAAGYYDRLLPALRDALDSGTAFSRPALAALGEKHTVCPFELGLSLSEWSDVVIGDYNYLFDPVVRLQRFFTGKGDWLFLVDEAHNLPDRAREMYSASLEKSSLLEAKRALGKGKSRLKTALTQADAALRACRKALAGADEDAPLPAAGQTSLFSEELGPEEAAPAASEGLFGGQQPLYSREGTRYYKQLPAALLGPLRQLAPPMQAWLEDHKDSPAHAAILNLYFALRDFLRTAEGYDDHYVTQLTAHGSELRVALLCLDPADFVAQSLAKGRAATLFSATITPSGYYKTVLGCPESRAVALQSPFPAENLGLYCLGSISTRYRDREASYAPIARALAAMVEARQGNYLAFFPSYAYLDKVQEQLKALCPALPLLVQESGLDEAARAAFLARFDAANTGSLLGLCVMGGVFGEGIDLVGDRLIGCAVVGVGLPQVNPRQEMLRQYYDAPQRGGCGFDFAYRYPGMNKVLQAAGRVIRTPGDRGVVLLIDDRFTQTEYRRLMPPHWKQLQYLYDTDSLSASLTDFWKR